MREIQLWAEEQDLDDTFSDIDVLAGRCRFRNCQHGPEPGCAVKESLEKGELTNDRLNNYLKMKSELIDLSKKQKVK
jgi:ribosome biogenesis GTPase